MYTDRKTTPLGWFKFYKYVVLPFNLIAIVYEVYSSVDFLDRGEFIPMLAIGLFTSILVIVCEIGLVNWKKYGVICTYILQWAGVAANALVLCVEYSNQQLTTLVLSIVISILWTIYFHHRAPLFSPDYQDPQPETMTAPTPKPEIQTPIQSAPKTLYCTQCGTKLLSDADFCHNCGAKISK